MSFFVFLVIVAVIIVLVVVNRNKKREEGIAKLKNGASYDVALQIKEKLTQEGYRIDEMRTYFADGYRAVGKLYIYKEGSYDNLGNMTFSNYINAIYSAEHLLQMDNIGAMNGYYYAIQNAEIGLIVRSGKVSEEIPPFLKIAAEVIKNSGYGFEHPKWINEDERARRYLNVMF